MENLGVNQQSNSVDNLFIPGFPVITKAVTIKSGAGVIAKNTVLGKETLGAVTVAADGGNTGNGVFTLDATTPKLARAKAGIYKVVCIAAATNGGTFRVTDPEGYVLGDVAVAATFSNQIKFSIADGATDFVVGDTFDVTIAAGSGKHLAYSSSNVDGTQYPEAILAAEVDATSADVTETAYITGYFNEAEVVGEDANAKELLLQKGIFFTTIQ